MTEQTKRLRKALEGCAERGISPAPDPWAEIEGRLDTQAAGGNRRFLQTTRTRLAFAAVLIVLFGGMGAYMGFPFTHKVFQGALPGSNTDRDLGTEIGQEQTGEGAKVVFEYAYADTGFVVVGYTVQELRKNPNVEGHPTELQALQIDDTTMSPKQEKATIPFRVNLTDEGGQDFDLLQGSTVYGADPDNLARPRPNVAIFAPSEGLEPGEKHRFRLNVALEETISPLSDFEGSIGPPRDGWAKAGPFVFDFAVPVRPVPVVEVGQQKTAAGVTLTLRRVLNSPGKPQAVVCFEPPDKEHSWTPELGGSMPTKGPLPVDGLGKGCWSLTMKDPVEGRSTVRVEDIFGFPRTAAAARKDEDGFRIRGPWVFEFEAPESPSAKPDQ